MYGSEVELEFEARVAAGAISKPAEHVPCGHPFPRNGFTEALDMT